MQGGVHFFEGRLEQIGKGDDHTVIQAPYKIMRLRTVPDADYGEHQQVGNCSRQNTAEVLAPVPVAHLPNRCIGLVSANG